MAKVRIGINGFGRIGRGFVRCMAEAPGVFDLVLVNDNDVNMRKDPSTDADIVDTLTNQTELEITGKSKSANDLVWWPVKDGATGNVGWVAEQYLDAE